MAKRNLTTRENTAPLWLQHQGEKGSFGKKKTEFPKSEVQAKVFTVLQMCEDLCLVAAPIDYERGSSALDLAKNILNSVGSKGEIDSDDSKLESQAKLKSQIEVALESNQVWEALQPHLESELKLFRAHRPTLGEIRLAQKEIDTLEEAGQVLTFQAKQNHGRLTAEESGVLRQFKERSKTLGSEIKTTVDTNEDETLDGFMAFQNLRDYKVQAESTGFVKTPTVKALISKTRNALIAGKKVFLLSPTGTGKTAMAGEVLSTLKGGIQVVACHEGMTPRDFHGYQEMQDGNTFWSAGPYEKAKTEGDGLLVDEVSTAPNRVLLELKSNMFKDRDLAVIFTGNPKDEHTQDRERMDPALLREMSGIKMDYIPATESRDIILAGLSKSWGIPMSQEEVGLIAKLCKSASKIQQLHMMNGDADAKKALGYDENDLIRNKFLDPGTLFSLFLEWEKDRAEGQKFSQYLAQQIESFLEDNASLRMAEETPLLQKILNKHGVISSANGKVTISPIEAEKSYLLPSELGFLVPEGQNGSGYVKETDMTTSGPEVVNNSSLESAEQLMGQNFFGLKDWADIYPRFPLVSEDIPPLPDNIESILNEDCPFSNNNEKVKDTHILFLLPKKVGGLPYTIDHMRDMTDQQTTPHKGPKFQNDQRTRGKAWFDDKDTHGGFAYTSSDSQWVLMPKATAPETKSKNYANQSNEVAQYSEYETAWANQLIAGIMLHFAKTGEIIFETEYGWCQDETADDFRVTVRYFDPDGLGVNGDDPDHTGDTLGRALVRKFS